MAKGNTTPSKKLAPHDLPPHPAHLPPCTNTQPRPADDRLAAPGQRAPAGCAEGSMSCRSPLRREARLNSSRFIRGATAPVHDRQTLAEDVDCSIVVGIHVVTATRTEKARLALAAFPVDCATFRTGLRRIGGVDLYERPAALFQLVGQHRFDAVPAHVENGSIEATLLCDAGIMRSCGHAPGCQRLDYNSAEFSANCSRLFMLPIGADMRRFGLEAGHNGALPAIPDRPALSSGQDTLRDPRSLANLGKLHRKSSSRTVRQSKRDGDAPVNANCWQRANRGLEIVSHSNTGKPNALLADNACRTDFAVNWARVAILDRSDLQHLHDGPLAVQRTRPSICGLHFERFMDARPAELRVASAFEKLGERFVQVLQGTMLTARGNRGDPIEFAAQFGQLPTLRNVIQRLSRRALELPPVIAALLKSQVVDEPCNGRELSQLFSLLRRWIEAIFLHPVHAGFYTMNQIRGLTQ